MDSSSQNSVLFYLALCLFNMLLCSKGKKIKVAFFEESSSFTFPYTTVHSGCVRILTDESELQAVYLHNWDTDK